VRPTAIALTLLFLTAACETSTDPFFGSGGGAGSPVTAAEVSGNWSFTVNHNTTFPCTGGSIPDGTVLTATVNVLTDGTVNGASSFWRTPATSNFPLSGSVLLSSGAADLFLSGGNGTGSSMELIGTMSPTGSFAGTLHDPAAGFSPIFSASGCDYSAAGTKA
jgi:hypothetical protein